MGLVRAGSLSTLVRAVHVAHGPRPWMTGVSPMNQQHEIWISLSRAQVAHVLSEAAHEESGLIQGVFGGIRSRARLDREYRALEGSSQISRSLLLALVVLSCFTRDGTAYSVKDIATQLGMSSSTAHRYLKTFVVAGILEQDSLTRRYLMPPSG